MNTSGKLFTYVDDTAIFYTYDNDNDIRLIQEFFKHRSLTLKFNKTFFLPVHIDKRNAPKYNIVNIEDGT